MAITIYKIAYHVDWEGTGVARPRGGGVYGGSALDVVDLSNYYTKENLYTEGQSVVHFDNIIEAEHNNLLGLQGGDDDSSGDSSGFIGDYYHLDEATYYAIIGLDFQMSIEKDGANVVTLVNDEEDPGQGKYYGTSDDSAATKGWHDLPAGGGTCLWEDTSGGFITPSESGGVGILVGSVYVDGSSIYTADGIDNDLSVYAGDALGAAGTDAGDLILKAGDAILADSGSTAGYIYLIPGNIYAAGMSYGMVYIGGASSNYTQVQLTANGASSNVSLGLVPKAAGSLYLGGSSSGTTYFQNSTGQLVWRLRDGYILGAFGTAAHNAGYDLDIRAGTAYTLSGAGAGGDLWLGGGTGENTSKGGDVLIYGGTAFVGDNTDGGDVYIYSGIPEGTGIRGDIYLGERSPVSGCLPEADSDEVYGVIYDPTTGKLSYAYLGSIGSGGGVTPYTFDMSLNEDSAGVVTLVNDEDVPGNDEYYGTNSSGTKGWHELTKGFQTAVFANPLNIDCTTYKDWICTVTGDCTVNLNNVEDGDAGMLELIIDGDSSGSEITVTFGAMWTKKLGLVNFDGSDGEDNIISWRAVGDGSTQEIIYTIGQIEV